MPLGTPAWYTRGRRLTLAPSYTLCTHPLPQRRQTRASPLTSHVCRRMLTYAGVCRRMLASDACLASDEARMLTYADVCWRMPTYAGVRREPGLGYTRVHLYTVHAPSYTLCTPPLIIHVHRRSYSLVRTSFARERERERERQAEAPERRRQSGAYLFRERVTDADTYQRLCTCIAYVSIRMLTHTSAYVRV